MTFDTALSIGLGFVVAFVIGRLTAIFWPMTAYYRDIWATKAKLAAMARREAKA